MSLEYTLEIVPQGSYSGKDDFTVTPRTINDKPYLIFERLTDKIEDHRRGVISLDKLPTRMQNDISFIRTTSIVRTSTERYIEYKVSIRFD